MKKPGEYNTGIDNKKYKTDYSKSNENIPIEKEPLIEPPQSNPPAEKPATFDYETDLYVYNPTPKKPLNEDKRLFSGKKLVDTVNMIKEEKEYINDFNEKEYKDDQYTKRIYQPIHTNPNLYGNSNADIQRLYLEKKAKNKKATTMLVIILIIVIVIIIPVISTNSNRYYNSITNTEKEISIEVARLEEHYKNFFPQVIINTRSSLIEEDEIRLYFSFVSGGSEDHIIKESYDLMLHTIKYISENNASSEERSISININDLENNTFEMRTYKSNYNAEDEREIYGSDGFSRWKIEMSPHYSVENIVLGIIINENGQIYDSFTDKPLDLTPYIEKFDRDSVIVEEFKRKEKIDGLS